MVEAEKGENIEFRWGKKKAIGGKKKDVIFYESFTYDGVEYFLYDSVYLYNETEQEPYIGKILKIWQNADKTKKVKILWFFRPCEIMNYIRAEDALHNELFLASGDGAGLANVNPLEVIAGKCNVLCTSNDSRNPQPSCEALKKADFVFFRTFDVGKLEVCNDICEKIAGIEAKSLLNRVDTSKENVKKSDKNEKAASDIAIVNIEAEDPSGLISSNGKLNLENNKDTVVEVIKENVASLLENKSSTEEQSSGACASDVDNRMDKNSSKQENIQGDNVEDVKKKIAFEERVKRTKSSVDSEHPPAKKPKLDSFDTLALSPKIVNEDVSKTKIVKDSHGAEDSLIQKPVRDMKSNKVCNGKILKSSSQISVEKKFKMEGQIVEVSKRPDADRSRWFKGLPWEERMKTAHEQGTLVLIQNLDPAYTSSEVEDLVWNAFNESCTAKMVQRTAYSIPHIGQAYLIFKTKEAAEKVVRMLDRGCLLLLDGRPVVGSFATPFIPAQKPTFCGHHSIDKLRLQKQREMKDAVWTSHCSQPNTVEYDMAMEWCLLQDRLELTRRKLFKQQEEGLEKLKSKLKSR